MLVRPVSGTCNSQRKIPEKQGDTSGLEEEQRTAQNLLDAFAIHSGSSH